MSGHSLRLWTMGALRLPGQTTAWRTPYDTSNAVNILTFSLALYISVVLFISLMPLLPEEFAA